MLIILDVRKSEENWDFEKINLKLRLEYSNKLLFFRWNFFQSYYKNFCGLYRHNQGIWNVYLIYNFTSVKNGDHTTHQWTDMSGKVKKMRFWKNGTQIEVGIFWQTSFFEAKLFPETPLRIFLWALRTSSKYLEDPPNLDLCVSKNIVTIRYTNPKILAKSWLFR